MEVAEFLRRARGLKVLVVGDLMLDRFVWGRVSRISPEAPVPVVEIEREDLHVGGAANVAKNLASLEAEPLLVGVLGDDEPARQLRLALAKLGLSDETVITDPSRRTTVKTRIIAHSQQVVRADWESTGDIGGSVETSMLEALERRTSKARAMVFSDYAKGALTPAVIDKGIELAKRAGIPVLADPKLKRYRRYRGIRLVTPNLGEAERFTGIAIHSEADIAQAAQSLLDELECDAVLITRGEQGMSLYERDAQVLHIPTRAREVFDVTGAGDTVIATAALALAAGSSLASAAELANRAAGIVVGKLGTAVVLPQELLANIRAEKRN
ncbi:MAG TPA: D-glycero-beta-D-manno-heptose-7-phosphate kinase [Vicinamibacteria bacterium]|nr:D-glycero-beta-D-manno-heptose-7-phosphate kinase [Vicinamibacteria bacterium]